MKRILELNIDDRRDECTVVQNSGGRSVIHKPESVGPGTDGSTDGGLWIHSSGTGRSVCILAIETWSQHC